MSDLPKHFPAGMPRRLGAMLYDAVLLVGVWFAATAVALLARKGEAFSAGDWRFTAYLLTVAFLFYGWFWTHGGQTLGMRAWRLRLLSTSGDPVGWMQALKRFAVALPSVGCFGLGLLWMLVDRDRAAWHDRLSGTKVIHERFDP